MDPLTPSPLKPHMDLSYTRTIQQDGPGLAAATDSREDLAEIEKQIGRGIGMDSDEERIAEEEEIRNFHEKILEGRDFDNSPEVRIREEISDRQFDFGQFFIYTLERGYGDDPDSIVKYEVILEDD